MYLYRHQKWINKSTRYVLPKIESVTGTAMIYYFKGDDHSEYNIDDTSFTITYRKHYLIVVILNNHTQAHLSMITIESPRYSTIEELNTEGPKWFHRHFDLKANIVPE